MQTEKDTVEKGGLAISFGYTLIVQISAEEDRLTLFPDETVIY